MVLRLLLAVLLLGVAGFCVFGYLATYEPLPSMVQGFWRVGYGLVAIASIAGVVWLMKGLKSGKSSSGNTTDQ